MRGVCAGVCRSHVCLCVCVHVHVCMCVCAFVYVRMLCDCVGTRLVLRVYVCGSNLIRSRENRCPLLLFVCVYSKLTVSSE